MFPEYSSLLVSAPDRLGGIAARVKSTEQQFGREREQDASKEKRPVMHGGHPEGRFDHCIRRTVATQTRGGPFAVPGEQALCRLGSAFYWVHVTVERGDPELSSRTSLHCAVESGHAVEDARA